MDLCLNTPNPPCQAHACNKSEDADSVTSCIGIEPPKRDSYASYIFMPPVTSPAIFSKLFLIFLELARTRLYLEFDIRGFRLKKENPISFRHFVPQADKLNLS